MASIFKWPFKRKQYAGLNNPRFVSDIVAANEAVIDGLKAISGLADIDFAIISGLDFVPGTPNTYTSGIFYLNGSFYFMGLSFSEGLYLAANPIDTMAQPFSDGNSRNIYTLLNGVSTSSPTDASPIFVSDMNSYRLGLKNIKSQMLVLAALFNTLKNAAFRDVGTTSGTVAAGDDSRFGYTKDQIDSLFALKSKVLQIDNTAPYTPSDPNNPATKGYADSASGLKLLWLGTISSDGSVANRIAGSLTITVAHGGTGYYVIRHNKGDNNFFVTAIGIDTTARFASPRSYDKTSPATFDVYVSDDASPNDATFELAIYQYY